MKREIIHKNSGKDYQCCPDTFEKVETKLRLKYNFSDKKILTLFYRIFFKFIKRKGNVLN